MDLNLAGRQAVISGRDTGIGLNSSAGTLLRAI
jgi:hypothetical protein